MFFFSVLSIRGSDFSFESHTMFVFFLCSPVSFIQAIASQKRKATPEPVLRLVDVRKSPAWKEYERRLESEAVPAGSPLSSPCVTGLKNGRRNVVSPLAKADLESQGLEVICRATKQIVTPSASKFPRAKRPPPLLLPLVLPVVESRPSPSSGGDQGGVQEKQVLKSKPKKTSTPEDGNVSTENSVTPDSVSSVELEPAEVMMRRLWGEKGGQLKPQSASHQLQSTSSTSSSKMEVQLVDRDPHQVSSGKRRENLK
jgi:hypothetical protein